MSPLDAFVILSNDIELKKNEVVSLRWDLIGACLTSPTEIEMTRKSTPGQRGNRTFVENYLIARIEERWWDVESGIFLLDDNSPKEFDLILAEIRVSVLSVFFQSFNIARVCDFDKIMSIISDAYVKEAIES